MPIILEVDQNSATEQSWFFIDAHSNVFYGSNFFKSLFDVIVSKILGHICEDQTRRLVIPQFWSDIFIAFCFR